MTDTGQRRNPFCHLQVEDKVGVPVDIEWAFDDKQVMFLQFRPITQPMLDFSFEWDSTKIEVSKADKA